MLYFFILRLKVSNWSFKPFPCIQHPPKHYQTQSDTQSNRRIIECVPRDWIVSWQKKDCTGITNPQEGHQANWSTRFPQIKWPGLEVRLSRYHSRKDWNCITTYPSYSANGSYSSENHIDFQDWKSKKNANSCAEPHRVRRDFVLWVHFSPYG